MGFRVCADAILPPEVEVVLPVRDDVLERIGRHVFEVLGPKVDSRVLEAFGDLG